MVRPLLKASDRFSVSETKAKLSEVLRRARSGKTVIVTDHGQDIARIEAIEPSSPAQLLIHTAKAHFNDVKNTQAPVPAKAPKRSALEILQAERQQGRTKR